MKANLIDGKQISGAVKAEIAIETAALKNTHGITAGLAVILVGDDPASIIYVRNKQREATKIGMNAHDIRLPKDVSQHELLHHIQVVGDDPKTHGMIVQLPLPSHIDLDNVIGSINPLKDVDGLHPTNVGLLAKGKERFIPATPSGIQQILIRTGHDPDGKHVVVCGRSQIVGKPLSLLLAQRAPGANATVTMCHTHTKNLSSITKQADILVAAMGQPKMISADMVKKGSVVIDVGTNRIQAPDRRSGYRLVGDVDFDSVCQKASAITPVPGGVGPMTIAMLLQNTLKAAKHLVE